MQNVEFKAELRDLAAARRQCELLGARLVGTLNQSDTYYKLPDGRLKRRETRSTPGDPGGLGSIEWIFYHRADRISPRLSVYSILTDGQARRRWGTYSLRQWLIVVKNRELWMLNNVRIHLDKVQELGTYLEFEAVVSPQFDVRRCHAEVSRLRELFAPVLGEPISASYSDLLAQAQADRATT